MQRVGHAGVDSLHNLKCVQFPVSAAADRPKQILENLNQGFESRASSPRHEPPAVHHPRRGLPVWLDGRVARSRHRYPVRPHPRSCLISACARSPLREVGSSLVAAWFPKEIAEMLGRARVRVPGPGRRAPGKETDASTELLESAFERGLNWFDWFARC